MKWATEGVRSQNRPGRSKPSVHGTGRAADVSWRRNAKWNGKLIKRSTGAFGNYDKALQVPDFWLAKADLFLIEELHDYYPSPFGRWWRCTRDAWKSYRRQTIGNSPGGDWFHVEIAPTHADDAAYYKRAFAQAIGKPVPKTSAPSGRPELT